MVALTASNSIDVWERRVDRVFTGLPYALLLVSTVSATVQSGQTTQYRAGTVGLAALAAVWLWWMLSANPQWSSRRVPMIVYFVGLLAIMTVLLTRSPVFSVFAITGFVQPFGLLSVRWAVLMVGSTAVVMNTVPQGLPDPTLAELSNYFASIVINTLLASALGVFNWVVGEQSERRRRAIAEVTEANRRLSASIEENADLHARLLVQAKEAGVLEERQRMAREIHDTLAQGLAGIITQLQAAEQAHRHPADWRRHLDNAATLARESLSEARRSVVAVRPEPLENARLPEALDQTAAAWSDLHGVPAKVCTTGTARSLHPEVEITLLRVAQEALANVAKHAAASRVALTLSYMEDVVMLDVLDDGTGFDPSDTAAANAHGGGFGLTGMRQRVRRLAGHLEIESEAGSGTAVSASVPAIPAGGAG